MILLQANQVSRRFADATLFEDVSFSIQTNDRIALVGRNGTGKSTLIKQIMGEEPLSDGMISRAKGLKVGYLEQHVAIDSDRTIWNEMLNVFQDTLYLRDQAQQAAEQLALEADNTDSKAYEQALERYDQLQERLKDKNAYAIESEIRTVLHGFRFYEEDYDRPVQSLSGGQKTRLALAQILLMDYDLLILDEPTNHLDMETLAWLENYLLGYQGALLIVSHDRYFLDKVAKQVIELRHNTLHIYKGNYSYYLKEKELRLEQEFKLYARQQDEIAKLEDYVRRNLARASTTKMAQSRRRKLEKIDRLEKPKQDARAPRIQFSARKDSGDRVLEASNLAIGYPDLDEAIARNINMDLRRQEAIAIVGPNGIGKTTYLKTLLGRLEPKAGHVSIGTGVEIGYYEQNVNSLNPNQTVLETLWSAHDSTDEWVVRSILGSFLFSGETVEKKVSMLSGGEKARLSLALLATEHDNTLLLDEPTNHLDIDSKEVLEEALIEYDGTLLFVSHDRYFINRIATQVLEISPDGATLYLGDYDYYLAKKAELEQIEAMTQTTTPAKISTNTKPAATGGTAQKSYEESKQLGREHRKLSQAVDKAWELNEQLETQIGSLHEQLAAAAETNDQASLVDLHTELKSIESEQLVALDTWEHASLELEEFLETNPEFNR
ncbi:ABC-F family ATP-binding cassette domain-containing protein [Fundicoccus ignavus]|uniref:ATP-binding cassette domain-containing protein n=1 Tax=Fundicoccus ignavus TaxID=2664442 RepID=A0A844CCD9_9LACT|nr:ABC-F family ATP-binding cassette domain-containing protein [Fundicoccus ignavus]MRJ46840.1 ATP-binding cassette domain-containing protein [Fundicoccus ignavus]